MKVINPEIIKEDEETIKKLIKTCKNPRLVPRLQMLLLIKRGIRLRNISKILSYGFSTIKLWWKKYREKGINGLLDWNIKGKQARLKEEQIKKLEEKARKEGFFSQKEAILWIEQEFGIRYSQPGISKLFKKLKIKKKVGRPVNIKKDERKEKEFREKKIKEIAEKNKGCEIFF